MDKFRKLKKTNSNTLKDLENTIDLAGEYKDTRNTIEKLKKYKRPSSHTLIDLEITVDFDREQEDERDAIDDLDEVSKSLHGLRTLASLLDL